MPPILPPSSTTPLVGDTLSAFPPWLRVRRYRHFDDPPPLEAAHAIATDPERVRTHAFWPFIRFIKETPRYKPQKGKVEPKARPICYAAHLDAHIFARYGARLTEIHESRLAAAGCDDAVLAYRPGRGLCNIDFAREAFHEIAGRGACVALAFDIESFFDTLNHDRLRAAWGSTVGSSRLPDDEFRVLKAVTRYARVDQEPLYVALGIERRHQVAFAKRLCDPPAFRHDVVPLIQTNGTGVGIPQGSPISAVLSNLYMFDFDKEMVAYVNTIGGSYRRYCDDILVIIPPAQEVDAESRVTAGIAAIGLKIQAAKTERRHFPVPAAEQHLACRRLQYLGFTFDGTRIAVRPQTMARLYRRMKTAVSIAGGRAAENDDHPDLYRRDLYERFSHLGKQNAVRYALRAARITGSPTVRHQAARTWGRLNKEIKKKGG